jgi:hypothetical protein
MNTPPDYLAGAAVVSGWFLYRRAGGDGMVTEIEQLIEK